MTFRTQQKWSNQLSLPKLDDWKIKMTQNTAKEWPNTKPLQTVGKQKRKILMHLILKRDVWLDNVRNLRQYIQRYILSKIIWRH